MAKIKSRENSSKRDTIQSIAANLFREKGYKATSMRDLAAKVGVEAASLYNHIASKSELLQNICFSVANRFTSKIEEVENKQITSIEKIEVLLRFHIHEMINNYQEVFVSDREWRQLPEPQLSEVRELRRDYRKHFAAIIQKGIDDKEIKEVDANTAVMIFLNAIGAIDQWHRIVHKVDSYELEKNIVVILTEGLRN